MRSTRINQFCRRWAKLADRHAKIDFEKAGLATEVRAEFAPDGAGFLKFRRWLGSYFELANSTASALAHSVEVLKMYPKESTWVALGGWKSLTFLSQFKTRERQRLTKACLAKAKEAKRGSISYSSVRSIAIGYGCRSGKAGGRPSQSMSEQRLEVLRDYIVGLHNVYDFGPVPEPVADALMATSRAKIKV